MHQQNENDVSFRAKKRPVVSGLHVPDILAQNRIFLGVMADETPKRFVEDSSRCFTCVFSVVELNLSFLYFITLIHDDSCCAFVCLF